MPIDPRALYARGLISDSAMQRVGNNAFPGQQQLTGAGPGGGLVPRFSAPVQQGELTPKPPYGNAPNSLMGFPKNGPTKPFEEQKYKFTQPVRVTFPDTGDSWEDAVKGLNRPHALERARRNWPGAQIEPIEPTEAENP